MGEDVVEEDDEELSVYDLVDDLTIECGVCVLFSNEVNSVNSHEFSQKEQYQPCNKADLSKVHRPKDTY